MAKQQKTNPFKMAKQQKTNPFKTDVENLPFHDFEKTPSLTCIVENQITLGEKDPFKVYVIKDLETQERKFVTSSYSIEKTVSKMITEYGENSNKIVYLIEFKGKTEVNGKPFNQFNIHHCTLEEFEEYNK